MDGSFFHYKKNVVYPESTNELKSRPWGYTYLIIFRSTVFERMNSAFLLNRCALQILRVSLKKIAGNKSLGKKSFLLSCVMTKFRVKLS